MPLFQQLLQIMELQTCNLTWMKTMNMHFKIASECKLLLTHWTNVSFHTSMSGKMIKILGANGESLSTSVTPVPGDMLVDMFYVFIQVTFPGKCTFTLWTLKSPVAVVSPAVVQQLAPFVKHWAAVKALVWGVCDMFVCFLTTVLVLLGKRRQMSCHVRR